MPTGKRNVEVVISAKDRASGVMKKFGAAMIGVAAAAGVALVAFKKFSDFLQQALNNAIIQEKAEIKLAGALSTLGQNTKEVRQEMAQFASDLQDKFAIADDVILNAMANIAGLGEISGEELKRATIATIGLTAASGDMAGNAIIMSKAVAGMASSLGRYIGTLDPALSETEKMEQAFGRIEKRLGPIAVALGQTMEAALKKLKFAYGDVVDAIGMAIFNTESYSETLAFATGKLKEFEQFVKDNRQALQEFGAASAESVALFSEALIKLGIATILAVQSQRALFAIHSGNILVIKDLIAETKNLLAPFHLLDDAIDSLQVRLKEFRETAAKRDLAGELGNVEQPVAAVVDEFENLNTIAKDLGLSSIPAIRLEAEKVGQATGDINQAWLDGLISVDEMVFLQGELAAKTERLQKAGQDVALAFVQVKPPVEEVAEVANELTTILATNVAGAAADVGGTLVDAAFEGQIQWGKFFKDLLKNLAKAIVQALIFKAVMAAFPGFGSFLGFGQSGGEVAGGQAGGRVTGPRSIGDTVPAFLQPGEIILPRALAADFSALADVARSVNTIAAQPMQQAGGGPPVNLQFVVSKTFTQDDIIDLMEGASELVERKGFTLTASEVIA